MWIWISDEQAIQEAQKELDEYNNQKAIDAIDDEIKAWQDYKKTWDNIPSDFEKMQNALIAQEILGKDAEADILNKRIDTFNDFKAGYLQILQDIEDATKRSNEKIKQLNLEATTNYVPDTSGSGGSGGGGGGGGGYRGSNDNNTKDNNNTRAPAYLDNYKIDKNALYSLSIDPKTNKPKNNEYYKGSDLTLVGEKVNGVMHFTHLRAKKGTKIYEAKQYPPTEFLSTDRVTRVDINGYSFGAYTAPINTPTRGGGGGVATLQTRASGSPFINRSGLYNINENGAELGIHNPARGSYTFLTHGDGILNAGLTRNIMALAQNPELAIRNVLGHILASGNNTTTNAQSQIINIQNVNLPNVNNATQFVKQLQLISQNH